MRKKTVGILLLLAILSGGGLYYFMNNSNKTKENPNVKQASNEKKPFYIETKNFGDFGKNYNLKKTAKIDSVGEVFLTSDAFGKLENLQVKEGQKVSKNQKIGKISDTTGQIGIMYRQATVSLNQAKIAYDSNKINLDKAIFDAELNLEKLQNNYTTLQKNIEQNIKQAENSLDNLNLSSTGSKSSLDLQKLDSTIQKLELDYQNKITADKQTLAAFLNNLKTSKDSLENLTNDVFDYGDKTFQITNRYKSGYSNYDVYLGAKNSGKKQETKQALEKLQAFKDNDLVNLKITDIEKVDDYAKTLMKGYELNTLFLNNAEQTWRNSVDSAGSLSQIEIDTNINLANNYQNAILNAKNGFVGLKNNINSFTSTYKEQQNSIQKQIDITKQDREIAKKAIESGNTEAQIGYDKTIIGSQDSLKNMEIQIKNAKKLLENVRKTKTTTLQNASNNIKSAQINVDKAGIEYSKLNLKAPISGVVAEVLVDVGQTYPTGTKIIKLVEDSKSEVEVYLPFKDLEKIQEGDQVNILYREQAFSGTIFSKSTLADENLNYKVIISLPEKINLIGGIAEVNFPLQAEKRLIPVNAVKVLSEDNIGEIQILSGGVIKPAKVQLGKTFEDSIEFSSDLPAGTKIILNDVSNFDEQKFNIIEKDIIIQQ